MKAEGTIPVNAFAASTKFPSLNAENPQRRTFICIMRSSMFGCSLLSLNAPGYNRALESD